MRLVVQRVKNANVKADGIVIGEIKKGFMVLLGVNKNDTTKEADYLVDKLLKLRVFEDENDKMNYDLEKVGGELLIISQFTLYADTSAGNRPSFINAARPEVAEPLYEYFCKECENKGYHVEKGKFGADMKVELLNDGPVTIILEK